MKKHRSLANIATDIYNHWPKVWFGARPYLEAMSVMDSIEDDYYNDSGRSIVTYFLSNAQYWRGEDARRIKKELNKILKGD